MQVLWIGAVLRIQLYIQLQWGITFLSDEQTRRGSCYTRLIMRPTNHFPAMVRVARTNLRRYAVVGVFTNNN
jgi:hypothetical protein